MVSASGRPAGRGIVTSNDQRGHGRRGIDDRSLTVKSLDVLAAFDTDHPDLTLSEVARRSQLPLTTVHRIVADLTDWGALERHPDGRYRVGLRLWEIAVHAPNAIPLRDSALPFMEDLYEVTHENIQLAVRDGLDVVFVERLAGRDAVGVHTRVGGRFGLSATGVGLVLLAHAPAAVQEDVLAGALPAWTDYTVVDARRLRGVLAQIRRQGYAISDRQVTDDAISLACPIVDGRGSVCAALSIVMHADTAQPTFLLPALRAAARGISRTIEVGGSVHIGHQIGAALQQ